MTGGMQRNVDADAVVAEQCGDLLVEAQEPLLVVVRLGAVARQADVVHEAEVAERGAVARRL